MVKLSSLIPVFIAALLWHTTAAQAQSRIVSMDIGNFWQAFDRIGTTTDTALQRQYLDELFIQKGSPGLKAIMEVRNYTTGSYLDAIRNYPLFWRSIRNNTLKTKTFSDGINHGIAQLKKLYPRLRPATVYFTIGALKTNGTTLKDQILIGSELALADSNTNTSEFPASLSHLKPFFRTNTARAVVFGNVHEYVHTQQKTTVASTLLGQCVLEGVAEFLAVKATGQASPTPAVAYGPEHDSRIKQVFAEQLFFPRNGFWLYSNQSNAFGLRDLGYYVGYAICERYYSRAKDKQKAVSEMVELDYNDLAALIRFTDSSGYFDQPLTAIYQRYESARPVVTGVEELSPKGATVSPLVSKLTVHFSSTMDTRTRGFDLGSLGEENLLRVKRFIGFSEDHKSISFEVELKPGHHYQLLLTDRFQDIDGKALKPYLIEFMTSGTP